MLYNFKIIIIIIIIIEIITNEYGSGLIICVGPEIKKLKTKRMEMG